MVNERFGPHLPPKILKGRDIDDIYELWGVDYAVEISLSDEETPEIVRPGYCGAYMSHFKDARLLFPIPRFLMEALVELGMAFAQMSPNFFHYFLTSWIRAREEGFEFGLKELKQLFTIKRNNGFLGTMILAPRAGRSVVDGIPNRDDRWKYKFFVFKINVASVGDFDFTRIPGEWSSEIEPFDLAPMTPELRGLIVTLRRGNPQWLAFTIERIRAAYALPPGQNCATPIGPAAPVRPGRGRRDTRVREQKAFPDRADASSVAGSSERARKALRGPMLRSRSQAQFPGLMAKPVSIAVPADRNWTTPNAPAGSVGGQPHGDDVGSTTHRIRRGGRVPGEGTSQIDPDSRPPRVREASSLAFSYDNEVSILENPELLPLIWRKIKARWCDLPSLEQMRERDAYIQMVVANAKAMEASNVYAALMETRLADFPSREEIGGHLLTIQQLQGKLEAARAKDQQREMEVEELKGKLAATEMEKVAVWGDLDSMKEKHRRELEGRDAAARRECHLACCSLVREYDAVLAVVKAKLLKKKEEKVTKIRLQEVRARIEALTEYNEAGYELEEEFERLKRHEVSLDVEYGLASVSVSSDF
ncbi:uncharacterized protein LOC125579878 [Brassica napus]|uniref:uncharacterized protein LOC125579878 n=1 Tax=Brassica napus TaxID=3708 RepID=UPI00207862B2|nr:uncharacterized protein LOC125579878 [Brassica napus]